MDKPHVLIHVAVSADGKSSGFTADVARFYELAATWHEDVTLAGSRTIAAQEPALAAAESLPGPLRDGPLLAVVDGGRRISRWRELRAAGHWSDVLALYSHSTPPRPSDGPREIVTGTDQVDLAAALAALAAEGARTVRVDSGSVLNGLLLRTQLVDEISLLIHPCLAGSSAPTWFDDIAVSSALSLVAAEDLEGGLLWVRYRPVRVWPAG
ncbi:pyrimidine reductase [Nocardia uniformis]|uniref:Pyrimidine reductase n=1 Tax=Nocardia uniformis TaxID=53432 RepID=A0A849BUX7_9NOCA|nr:dihydrofolate reductase family protein [Nocardia uniformis]NNH68696.1 pyrimidine reductase [Nocardia uniformis]